jgi:hypothetical protein
MQRTRALNREAWRGSIVQPFRIVLVKAVQRAHHELAVLVSSFFLVGSNLSCDASKKRKWQQEQPIVKRMKLNPTIVRSLCNEIDVSCFIKRMGTVAMMRIRPR